MSVVDDIISGKDVTNRNKKKKQQSTTQQNTTSKKTTQQNKTNKRSVTDTVVSPRIKTTKQPSEEERARQEAERYVKNLTDSWKEHQSKTFNLGKLGKDAINFGGKALNAPIKMGANLGKGAAKTGQNLLNGYIDYVASGNAEKDAKNVAKEAIKLAIDPNERKKVAKKALVSGAVGSAQMAKGAVKTLENWYDTLQQADTYVNSGLQRKLGIIDEDEYERIKERTAKDVAYDFTGNTWKKLGWNEDNDRVLKENSYITENNLGGQFLETVGQQVPGLILGETGMNYMTGGAGYSGLLSNLKNYQGLAKVPAAAKNLGTAALFNSASNAEMAIRSYGAATEQAINEGATLDQAKKYGILSALNETVTEWMTGGIPGLENSTGLLSKWYDKVVDKATGGINSDARKKITQALLHWGGEAFGEGLEELTSDIIDPFLKNATYTEDERVDLQNAFRSFLFGMASGAFLGGGQQVASSVNNRAQLRNQQRQDMLNGMTQQAIPKMRDIWQQRQMQQQNQQMFNQSIDNQVNQIEQAVATQQITPQQGQQALAILQNQNNGVQPTVTPVQQQTPIVEQENIPTINETTQDNINTQEQQNVAQNANNEVEQKQDYEGLNQKEYNEIQRRYKNLIEEIGFEEDFIKNATPSEIIDQLKMIKETAYGGDGFLESARMEGPEVYRQTKSQYDKINRLINRFENKIGQQAQQDNISKQSEAFNLGKNENVETQTKPKGKVMSLQEISDRLGVKNNNVEKTTQQEYNKVTKEEGVEDEFRRLQEESRRMSSKDTESFHSGQRQIDEGIRNRLSRVLGRRLQAGDGSLWNGNSSIVNKKTGKNIEILENVDPQTFKETFEIVQKYLPNGDAVDVHDVKSSEYSTGYEDTKNFLSKDGLSGFAITKDGDLISVFNLGEKGYLKSIKDYVKKNGAKTLDCYQSERQPLADMYNKTLGFKTASLMDFNYDILVEDKGKEYADYFVKTYGEAPVAFMVDTDQDIETKHFNKDQYNEALEYRNSLVDKEGTSDSSFSNETTQQTAKQITDAINNEIKSDEIISNIEKEEGKPVRQGVKTITNATGTVQLISDMDNKVITYEPLSNEKVLNQVRGENYKKDLPTLYKECIDFIQSDKRIHAKDIAKIELTLMELQNNFNQQENVDMFTDLVQQAATLGTTDAQALQFMGVIKKLNPMAQLTSLQKAVENSIRKKDKAFEGVQIKQELVDKVLQTQKDGKVDQKAFDEAMNSLMDDIASQMKVSFADKANNLRYLAMLCNFKTHLRNITGNTLMYGLQSYKDLYAAIGESTYDAVQKLRGKEGLQERTATLNKATKEIKEFSKQKAAEIVKNQKNKYYESPQGIVGELKSRRKIWSDKNIVGKASNKLNKVNNEALNLEDKMFSKSMTQKRLANYLAANMIRTQADIDAHPEIVARAIDYATYKGKEVTYHQDSTTADTIRKARDELYRGSGYSKALGFGIDATLPFTSTPTNIAKTALEYTPGIGTLDLNKQIKNAPKELKANVVIDSIAKQFSGLTLVGAGIFLASKGWLRGLGPGDKEDKIREDLGEKTYSLKIGNQYFDTSFLAPSTIPIFEGVELYNSMKDKDGFDANVVIDTLFGSLNPATDMSVMQSVLSMMKSVGRGGNEFQNAASQTLSNYFMQYFPTLLSQAAQASDPYQRDTTTKKTTIGKTYDQIKYKLPFARQTLPKKVDVWGEEKKNAENPLIRAAEAFFSPSNRSESKVDDTTKELFDLNKKLPDSNYSILPTKRGKTFEIEGETYQANERDYEELQKTYGKTAKSNLDKLIKSDSYRKANDKDKAYMVSAIYDYANYKAKEQYSKNNDVDYANSDTNRYALIDAFGVDFSKYIEQRISKIQADKDENGNSLKNTAVKYLEAYNNMGLNDLQKQAFMNFDNKSYYIDEKAVKNKINSSDLSDKQKKLLIEKFNKTVTDNERALYKRAENIGVDYDLYTEFRNFAQNAKADKTKNGGYVRGSKKQKVIDWIDSQYLTAEQKQKLYEDYLNNQVTFTTYK